MANTTHVAVARHPAVRPDTPKLHPTGRGLAQRTEWRRARQRSMLLAAEALSTRTTFLPNEEARPSRRAKARPVPPTTTVATATMLRIPTEVSALCEEPLSHADMASWRDLGHRAAASNYCGRAGRTGRVLCPLVSSAGPVAIIGRSAPPKT
jgi:hypothetical protein